MDQFQKRIKPFVKWAGGKTQILNEIHQLVPQDFNRIVEPFVGGGSVFLSFPEKPALINDLNKELITTYHQVKRNPSKMIEVIDTFVEAYNLNPEQEFFNLRDQFKPELAPKGYKQASISARFIFINKTCFNGLYQVNSQGIFNTPWNKKDHVVQSTIADFENIMLMHKRLQNTKVYHADFSRLTKMLVPGDFVFVDPPYDSDTSTFDSYTKQSFGKRGQERLFHWLERLTEKGIKWMLTNHDTKLIRELYGDKYNIKVVTVNRFINADATKRTKITKEVIITNY